MTEPVSVVAALTAVMAAVQAVGKKDKNQQQGFNFRGVDAVVNAVGPALRANGVVVVPTGVSSDVEQYVTKSGTPMRNTTLTITWRFYGPAGDFIDAQSMGEAADAGDKSVTKAHSIAYRVLLLQALCIPTDEPEPDASSNERAALPGPKAGRGAVRPPPDEPDFTAADVERFEQLIDGASTGEELNAIAAEIAGSSLQGSAREALRLRFSAKMKAVTA